MSVPRSSRREAFSTKMRRSESADTRTRGSYVPERKRPSSEERRSGNRWSGVRGSVNLSDVKRKDIRPLTDKAYQKRKIADLVAFLEEQDFKYPISISKLAYPSKKDFEVMFQFLYSSFDPKYEVKKIEEEVPKILKFLGYPFNINKSALTCVARTNWPSLLGVLIWLMDLNQYAINVDINTVFEIDTVGEDCSQVHRFVLRYICQSHHSGSDNPEEEEAVFNKIVKSSIVLKYGDVDELHIVNKEKNQLVKDAENELEVIKQLSNEKACIEQTIEKYEKYIEDMKVHAEKKKDLKAQLTEKLKIKESELKTLQDQIAVKQEAYDAQGFDGKKQLSYFESQKKELVEKLEKRQTVVKDLQEKIWDAEIQFKHYVDKVDDTEDSINKFCSKTVENAKSIAEPLTVLKNPHIQKMLNQMLDFSSWEIPSRTGQPEWMSSISVSMENMSRKMTKANELLQRMAKDFYLEKLNTVQRQKSELKLLLVKESHSEKDLSSNDKKLIDEVKVLETRCEAAGKSVAALKTERQLLQNTQNLALDELELLKAFHTKKLQKYNTFVKEHEQIYQDVLKIDEEVSLKVLEYRNEIMQKLESELV